MSIRLQKIIASEKLQDLVGKLVVVLGIVYLLLFCAESVLPGMVVEVMNINFLLLFLILAIGYFAWLDKKGERKFRLRKPERLISYGAFALLLPVVVVTLLVVQYKIGISESIFYVILGAVIAKLFHEMFK